jgi:hypothetical protein
MSLKKHSYSANEIPIYDEAIVMQRGEYWQMRMWLTKEKKYARFSLKTRNRETAIDKAKKYYHELMAQQLAGKTYFSKTAKRSGPVCLNSDLSILSGISADSHAASLTVGSITA